MAMGLRNEFNELTFIATTDLSGKRGYAVAFDGSNPGQVILANAQGTPPIGLLFRENRPGFTNDRVAVCMPGAGVAPAVYGGTVAAGDKLTADSTGKLITTTTSGDKYIAIALEAGATGEVHGVHLEAGYVH
jgi:hypothetical protein